MGSMILWHPAHGAFARCRVICSRSDSALPLSLFVSSSGGTLGGGSGGGVPRMFSRTHAPRLTGDVRKFCVHVTARKLPLPRSPRRYSISGGSVTRRKRDP